jgi:hypothetical protein
MGWRPACFWRAACVVRPIRPRAGRGRSGGGPANGRQVLNRLRACRPAPSVGDAEHVTSRAATGARQPAAPAVSAAVVVSCTRRALPESLSLAAFAALTALLLRSRRSMVAGRRIGQTYCFSVLGLLGFVLSPVLEDPEAAKGVCRAGHSTHYPSAGPKPLTPLEAVAVELVRGVLTREQRHTHDPGLWPPHPAPGCVPM